MRLVLVLNMLSSLNKDIIIIIIIVHRGSTDDLLLLQISSGVVWQSRDLQLSRNTLYLLSPRLCFFIVLKYVIYLFTVMIH